MAKEAQELSRSIESRETKLEEVVYRANLAAKIGLKEAEESVFGRDSHGVDSLQSRVNQLNETFTNLENLARYYANESESLRTQSATALSEVESIEMDKHKYQDVSLLILITNSTLLGNERYHARRFSPKGLQKDRC